MWERAWAQWWSAELLGSTGQVGSTGQRVLNGQLGSIGLVIGATVALADFGLDRVDLTGTPILAPGFGFQGATIADAPMLFPGLTQNVLVSVSRSVLSAGPDGIASAIDAAAQEVRAWPN